MHSFCWHVLHNSSVHERLAAEIVSGKLSDVVSYQEALSLRYFQACLKEAMRLQPALAFNMSRRAPEEGAVVDGTHLPGGTHVAVNAWVVHRDKELFGPDADIFNPERWLNCPEEKVREMDRSLYQVSIANPSFIPVDSDMTFASSAVALIFALGDN